MQFAAERHRKGGTGGFGTAHEREEVASGCGPLPGRIGQMTKNEPPVALPARSGSEVVDRGLKVFHSFAQRDPDERQMGTVERLVVRSPAHGARQNRRGLCVAMQEKEHAPQSPQMESPPRSWRAARGATQMRQRGLRVPFPQSGSCGVLMQHVTENLELERLKGDGVRFAETAGFIVREAKLPQKHRPCRLVQPAARRKPLPSPAPPRGRRARRHRFVEKVFGRSRRRASGKKGGSLARTRKGRCCSASCSRHADELTIRAPLRPKRARRPRVRHGTLGFLTLALIASALVATGCGRRATEADCRLIVDRSVELQMKELSHNDVGAIAERERQVRDALEDEIKLCESRRVTDKTMVCVRAASTLRELDTCLR